jgi:hypothetical protein
VTVSGILVSLTHPCPCSGCGPGSNLSGIGKHADERETDDSWPCWAESHENYWEQDYEDYAPLCADGFLWTCCEKAGGHAALLPCDVGSHREEDADAGNDA